MKKILGLISLFTIFLLVLSACSSEPSEPSEPSIELRIDGDAENIAGGSVNMLPGSQFQFRATLVQNGVAISGAQIGWNLVLGSGDLAQRNATSPVVESDAVGGLVRISPNQPDGLLRLNVTTAHEGNLVSTHVNINVDVLRPLTIPNTAHETFQDPETGTWWRVLLPNDGNGNALIITEYVHLLNTRYHSDRSFTLFQSTEASNNLRRWWNNEWSDNGITASPHEQNVIGIQLRAMALDYEFQDESGFSIPRTNTAPGTGIEIDRGNGTENSPEGFVRWNTDVLRGRTRPISNSNYTAEPFILSTSEANHYFNGRTGSQGSQARPFNDPSVYAFWWLRSPAPFAIAPHALMTPGGIDIAVALATQNHFGLRPALWIQR